MNWAADAGSRPVGPRKARPRRWIVAIVIAWTVAIVGFGAWGIIDRSTTDREQTTVAQALPVVDRAVAEVVSAATVDGLAVVSISDFSRQSTCHVTTFRSGTRYQRIVTALVQPGTEDALVRRVADRLPSSYQAMVSSVSPITLTADAGLFVGVEGSTQSPGVVRFIADTGDCRATGELPTTATTPSPSETASVGSVLSQLGATPISIRRYAVACPAGGELTTVEAIANPAATPLDTRQISQRLNRPAGVSGDGLYGSTSDSTQLAVRLVDDDRIDVTSTVLCRAR